MLSRTIPDTLRIKKSIMIEINKFGYFWLDTWVLASVIQLATQEP